MSTSNYRFWILKLFNESYDLKIVRKFPFPKPVPDTYDKPVINSYLYIVWIQVTIYYTITIK